jgi:hypothetical protein
MPRDLLELLVVERADDERVEVAREGRRRVADRLPARELQLVGSEADGVAAELRDRDLERDARPRRRLAEEQPERPPRQQRRAGVRILLQLERQRDGRAQLVGAPVGDAKEVATRESAVECQRSGDTRSLEAASGHGGDVDVRVLGGAGAWDL